MNKRSVFFATAFGLCATLAQAEVATTYYVDAANGSDNADGLTWGTARKNIQSAIDSATNGCTILVADGVYNPFNSYGKSIVIQSSNGAESTIIHGNGTAPCAEMGQQTTNTVLRGFSLVNGKTGAVGGIVTHCRIHDNSGAGVGWNIAENCLIFGNHGQNGGGAIGSIIKSCTIINNTASSAGDSTYNCAIINSIACGRNFIIGNASDEKFPALAEMGFVRIGICSSNPEFVDAAHGDYRLAAGSPCINSGDNAYVADGDVDLDGNPRIIGKQVDIGCFEFFSLDMISPFQNIEISTGKAKWFMQMEDSLDEAYIARSASIPDGTNSWMKTVVTGPGKLSFDWKVSCENRYAYLQVLIDGVQKKRITGVKDWDSLLFEIAAGEHEVVWNYVKDGAAAVGEDAGFVRNISWRPYLAFSSSSAHGTALPADNDALLYGDEISASVDASVTDGDVRYDCVGWIGTGSAPAAGASNECAFALKEDSSLAWLWRTNYWTTLSVEGPATADFSEAWLEAGSVHTVAVAPSAPYYAITLSGDTEGVTLDGTNVVIVADGPRELTVSVRELTLAGALSTTDLAWRTGCDSVWFPEAQVSADGLDAAQSGSLDARGTSWIETTVVGPGTLAFQWKLATGGTRSGIDLLVDGDYEDSLESDADWTTYSLDVESGSHVVRWEFWNKSAEAGGAAWLDQVSWDGALPMATSTTPDPVPYVWLDAEAEPFVTRFLGDYEAAGNATAANGVNTVWECYVAGISPTNETQVFRTVISWHNGQPKISWEPKLAAEEESKRVYTEIGKTNLTEEGWTKVSPANRDGMRFFKVKVEMK